MKRRACWIALVGAALAASCRDDEGWDAWTWVVDPPATADAGDGAADGDAATDDAECAARGGDDGATILAGGWNHVLVVGSDGAARSWGANEAGQLGRGDADVHTDPGLVLGGPFVALVGGARHSCGIRTDGTLWCWGVNVHGQLGTGDTIDRHAPAQVGVDANWAELACGGLHTCARRTDGTLWCWGANAVGQVGIGAGPDQLAPRRVGLDFDWATLGAMTRHTCAVKTNGTLWCWGDGSDGQLGQGDVGVARDMPTQVGTSTAWRRTRTGALHSCAIDADDALWCWGANDAGQLGLGDTVPRSAPVKLGGDRRWTAVRGGFSHTCGLTDDGALYCWGEDAKGQVAQADLALRSTPTRVGADAGFSAVVTGQAHTCALRGGRVRCWGDATWTQLGGPSNEHANPAPVRVCLAPVKGP